MLWERGRIVMDDGGDDDFTFAAAHAQPPPRLLSAGGDGGGFMDPPLLYPVFGRPRSPPRMYPVFGRPRSPPRPALDPEPEKATAGVPLRQLLLVDKDKDPPPPPAPADDELDSVPEEMYCLWSPGWSATAASSSKARCKKSGSTGSVLRWKPRLDVGRSQSDGKEKFVFLSTAAAASSSPSSGGSSGRRNQKGRGGAVEGAVAGAHAWSCYVDNNKSRGTRRRRSFLPYKQDLVGLFANTAVFRRSYLPF